MMIYALTVTIGGLLLALVLGVLRELVAGLLLALVSGNCGYRGCHAFPGGLLPAMLRARAKS